MLSTAGLSDKARGKRKERQVPFTPITDKVLTTLQCTRWSTSWKMQEELLSSKVDYEKIMYSLVNTLNNINLRTCQCVKCKENIKEGWILDSGASVHFTMHKSDFINFSKVHNAPPVKTASKKAPLQVKERETVLLSHQIEINCKKIQHYTCIYPVLLIPGLSVKLLSMGLFLVQNQELRGNSEHIAFYDGLSHKQTLIAHPNWPGDTIYWIKSTKSQSALFTEVSTIYMADYNIWHKCLGHPSKDVLR